MQNKTNFWQVSRATGSILGLAALTLTTGLVASLPPQSVFAQTTSQRETVSKLEGTWRVLITPPAASPYYSYVTYNRGGTLIQSAANQLEGSYPGQGVWRVTGRNQFTIAFEKFISFNPLTGQEGIFVFKVEENITLAGDSYTGASHASICQDSGQQCQPLGPAQTSGKRLGVRGE